MSADLEKKVQDLEDEVTRASRLAEIKSQELDSFKTTNEALAYHLRSRWIAPQVLMVLLAFLFTINFGYQLYKTEDIREFARQLQAAKNELDLATNENRKLQQDSATVVEATTQALRHLTAGYHDAARRKYRGARLNAQLAENTLQAYKSRLAHNTELQQSLDTLIAACLILNARCSYFVQDYKAVNTIAGRLLLLDDNDWSGHHYRGLYYMTTAPYDKRAIPFLERSLELHPRFNPDQFNILELYFVTEQYDKAFHAAAMYLEDYPEHQRMKNDKGRVPVHLSAIADLYGLMAATMTRAAGAVDELETYIASFRKSSVDLSNTFDPSALKCWQGRLASSESTLSDDRRRRRRSSRGRR